MTQTNEDYLTAFFQEKEIPHKDWEIEANGNTHFISNEVVIEHIKVTVGKEQSQIVNILREIDFKNGDVNHFLKHLATGLANNY